MIMPSYTSSYKLAVASVFLLSTVSASPIRQISAGSVRAEQPNSLLGRPYNIYVPGVTDNDGGLASLALPSSDWDSFSPSLFNSHSSYGYDSSLWEESDPMDRASRFRVAQKKRDLAAKNLKRSQRDAGATNFVSNVSPGPSTPQKSNENSNSSSSSSSSSSASTPTSTSSPPATNQPASIAAVGSEQAPLAGTKGKSARKGSKKGKGKQQKKKVTGAGK